MSQAIQQPLETIEDAVMNAVPLIQDVISNVKKIITEMETSFMVVINGVARGMSWLEGNLKFCDKDVKQTPFHKCSGAFRDEIVNCR